jgi:ribosomal protein L24
MKIRIIKGKNKGTRGRVVGVYMDGRYDINVTNRKPNQPKQMVVKMTHCQEVK